MFYQNNTNLVINYFVNRIRRRKAEEAGPYNSLLGGSRLGS